jgi:hypothetical protein
MERLLLVIIVASLGLAWTTTIDSNTEANYLRCKSNFDCYIKEKAQNKAQKVFAKPIKHRKTK